jgi:RsiW-degrading membrane proteinase PrsW (M82 family)
MLNFPNLSRLPETLATPPYRRPAFFALVAVGIMCAIGYFLSDPMLYNSPHGWYIYAPSTFVFQWRAFGLGLVAALLQGLLLLCVLRFILLDKSFWQQGKGNYAAIFGLATPGITTALAYLLGWLNPLNFFYVAGMPLLEEVAKGLVFAVLLLAHRRMNLRFGWLIGYAVVVGIGFASVENIKYYSEAFNGAWFLCRNNASDVCFSNILIVRGLLSPFEHSFFTAITAYGIWWATQWEWKRSGRFKIEFWATVFIALVGAFLIHSIWNGLSKLQLGLYIGGTATTIVVILFTYLESKGLSQFVEDWFERQTPHWELEAIQQDERGLRNQLAAKSALSRIFSSFNRK